MSINSQTELTGMKEVSLAAAETLKAMREYARPGMTTKDLDEFGAVILRGFGARSAPRLAYRFPGHTCICVNEEVAHGIPSSGKRLKEGDLVNIDVSAELNGFWADNGGSFVLGKDIYNLNPLVEASRSILRKAIFSITAGVKISAIGGRIEYEAKKRGYRVIKNLNGHGIGRNLHEEPSIANYYDKSNNGRLRSGAVVAIETFISTHSSLAVPLNTLFDKWTLVGNQGGYVTQHEHTIVVTDSTPVILTEANEIWV